MAILTHNLTRLKNHSCNLSKNIEEDMLNLVRRLKAHSPAPSLHISKGNPLHLDFLHFFAHVLHSAHWIQ